MKLGFRALLLLLAGVTGLVAAPSASKPPAPKPAAKTDGLKDFRTVETATTTRIRPGAAQTAPEAQAAYLGISVESPRAGQVVVSQVEPGSPADRAGIKPGDTLREIAGQAITGPGQLREVLQGRSASDALKIVIERKGKPIQAEATLTATSRPLRSEQRAVLGVQVEPTDGKGARIAAVVPGSAAARAGIKVGDVIIKVDGHSVDDADRLGIRLQDHRPGDEVTLSLKREGKSVEVKARLAADRTANPRRVRWDDRQMRTFTRPVYRLAVIAIEYPDVKHNKKVSIKDWEKALFSRDSYKDKSPTGQAVYGSLNDYYREISCGAFRVEGKVFDYVQVKRKRTEYGSMANRFALLNEAIDKVLDRDGKNALKDFDGLFFLYAGGRVQTTRGGLYWPHRASVRHNGKFWPYFICPEGGERMASISVVAHEFGHLLGLPDLYASNGNPGSEGLGIWCTMSTGHGRDGKPLHFSAWCKERLGWITPAVLDPTVKQKLILAPIEGSKKECYKVLLHPDGSEYLLLENRVRKNFDRDLPGEGLLIWRVANGRPILEESHGITTPDGPQRFLGSVPSPSRANNAFTPYTTPSSKSMRSGGLPVHITNIRRLPDGRVTFFIGYEFF